MAKLTCRHLLLGPQELHEDGDKPPKVITPEANLIPEKKN